MVTASPHLTTSSFSPHSMARPFRRTMPPRPYQPTPADLAEQALAAAVSHPAVIALIAAGREAATVLGYVPGVESTYRNLESALAAVRV